MTELETLQTSVFSALTKARYAFFTRNGGVSLAPYNTLNAGLSSKDAPAHVEENRRRMAAHLGVSSENFLTCYQIHSADVATVEKIWKPEDRPRADALVTKQKGIAIGILTADCVPVLFVDEQAEVIGAAHAGWRGAQGGVLENTIIAMEKLGATRNNIRAALGACIWKDSYEVGAEFPAPFLDENAANAKFFTPASREDHLLFDLPAYVIQKLKSHGIPEIGPSVGDTYADQSRFFSYRRSTLTGSSEAGRLASVIVLS